MKIEYITLASITLILSIMEFAICSSTRIGTEGGMALSTLVPPVEPTLGQKGAVVEGQVQGFETAIKESNFIGALEIYYKANDETRRQCGEHLVSLEYDGLVQMIDGIDDDDEDKEAMLGIVLAHADQALSNRIIDKVKPGDELLKNSVDGNVELACNPDRFMIIVKRITSNFDQRLATGSGVDALFDKDKTEYLDPMISAFQSEASPNPNLANAAIRGAFLKACQYTDHRSSFAKRFHDHRAISAKDYSTVLYNVYVNGKRNHKLFKWLIKRADRDDLKEFMSWSGFQDLSQEDQEYVKNRLESIPEGSETRHERGERLRQERVNGIKKVLEAFQDLGEYVLPSVLTDMIVEYDEFYEKGERLRYERRERIRNVLERSREIQGRALPPVLTSIILQYDIVDQSPDNSTWTD